MLPAIREPFLFSIICIDTCVLSMIDTPKVMHITRELNAQADICPSSVLCMYIPSKIRLRTLMGGSTVFNFVLIDILDTHA
jgi:hypothetical protein